MALSDQLSGSLQENILTLICTDEDCIPILLAQVDVDLFESEIYRNIARAAISFYHEHKKAPGSAHLADILEKHLKQKSSKRSLYKTTVKNILSLAESINTDFVLAEVSKFIRQQQLRRSITRSAEFLQAGDVEQAELEYTKGFRPDRSLSFDKGVSLREGWSNDSLWQKRDNALIKTTIRPLDKLGLCPARGELFIFVSPPNKGKTWFLIQLGKAAVLQRKKVVHITLEMRQQKIVSRYTQSFFSLANREDENLEYFKLRDPKASNVDWKGFQFDVKNFRRFVSKRKRHAVENATYRRRLLGYEDRVEGFVEGTASDLVRRMGNNLIVKEFPTSRLTMPMLESYLETLDVQDNFQPDLLILDYIDLMKLNPDRIRIDTQQLYKELRGLGMERNMAIASVSQTNKSGEDVDLITAQYLAEDYQKSANADTIITYNQTTEEKRIGLARLLSLKSRDQRTGDIIVVSQAYNVGQFAVDAALLPYQFGYKDLIAKTVEQSSGDSGPRRRRKVRRRKLTGR